MNEQDGDQEAHGAALLTVGAAAGRRRGLFLGEEDVHEIPRTDKWKRRRLGRQPGGADGKQATAPLRLRRSPG